MCFNKIFVFINRTFVCYQFYLPFTSLSIKRYIYCLFNIIDIYIQDVFYNCNTNVWTHLRGKFYILLL